MSRTTRVLTRHSGTVYAAGAALSVACLVGLAQCSAELFLPPEGADTDSRVVAGPEPTASRRAMTDRSAPPSTHVAPSAPGESTPRSTDDEPVAADETTQPVVPVRGCSSAAARFGAAYAQRPGEDRAAWTARVRPHLDPELAARINRTVSFDTGRLPAGEVTDTAVEVDGSSCVARVAYADGATMSPELARAADGSWRVSRLPELLPAGGQRALVQPTVTAPPEGSR